MTSRFLHHHHHAVTLFCLLSVFLRLNDVGMLLRIRASEKKESADSIALHAFTSGFGSKAFGFGASGAASGRVLVASGPSDTPSAALASKFQQQNNSKPGSATSCGGSTGRGILNGHFRSSSSQTTFLDRNIVQNLAVEQGAAPVNTSSSKLSSVGGRTTTTVATGGGAVGGGYATRRRRPKTVPASYTSGSGSVKRASFSGTLPDGM